MLDMTSTHKIKQ